MFLERPNWRMCVGVEVGQSVSLCGWGLRFESPDKLGPEKLEANVLGVSV